MFSLLTPYENNDKTNVYFLRFLELQRLAKEV